MTFEIEHNIPMPKTDNRGRREKYPFSEMSVSDSFFVPGKTAVNFQGTATAAAKRYPGTKFRCRDVDGGVRCWRVE